MRLLPVIGVAALLLPAVAFAAGYKTAPATAHRNPIRLENGVPVGVLDTPVGALAAADNYVSAEDDALLSGAAIRRVVDTLWVPRDRAIELAQPFPAAAVAGRPAKFSGLKLTAAVAGHKLESYSADTARVGVWHEITVWSSTLAPAQRWSLDTLTLVWDAGRWLVASRSPLPDSRTPVPAWTSGGAADRTAQAFNSRLVGMSGPYYGGPSR
jgi:hypothetical protein